MRVFLTHNPEDLDAYYGRALPELHKLVDVVLNPLDRDLTTAELVEAAAGCQIIVAHRATPGEASLFERSPDLLAMFRCAIDISTIDVDAASSAGVLIANADKSFIASTAELALGLLIDVARNISESTVDYRNDHEPSQRPGWQLKGSTAGIIGYGSIGTYLATLLDAIGMRVIVHDPMAEPTDSGIERVGFTELLADSDVVFPLTPGGDENAGLIGSDALAAMKPGAVLVNVSRGEVLDEAAVSDALSSGQLGALAIDVGQAPDQRPSSALARLPHVVATPHLGGLTPANADAQAASSIEQVQAVLDHRMPPRAVNSESADRLQAHWAR